MIPQHIIRPLNMAAEHALRRILRQCTGSNLSVLETSVKVLEVAVGGAEAKFNDRAGNRSISLRKDKMFLFRRNGIPI